MKTPLTVQRDGVRYVVICNYCNANAALPYQQTPSLQHYEPQGAYNTHGQSASQLFDKTSAEILALNTKFDC